MSDAPPRLAGVADHEPAAAAGPAAVQRIDLIDALRAFALFGILQVNIQSFAWGAGDPLGAFADPPRTADAAVFLLLSTFVVTKFVALFAFLFGVGFALQTARLRRRLADGSQVRRVVRRRLWFLLAVGIAHGTLLYYGDILTAYAVCGFVLVLYAGVRPRRLARACVRWAIGFAVLAGAVLLMVEAARLGQPVGGDPSVLPADVLQRFEVYTRAGWLEQWPWRVADYATVTGLSLLTYAPFVVALFLLGALAGRLGWLTHPQRHRRVWATAARVGGWSLPVAALGAWLNFVALRDTPGDPPVWGMTLIALSFGVCALYVAAIVRHRDAPPVRAAVAWLAPAGRMPLTNYLLQSVLMAALLSGYGLGWGATLRHAELAALALAIVAVQLVASRLWIRHVGQGPVEALWRRVTYGRTASARP